MFPIAISESNFFLKDTVDSAHIAEAIKNDPQMAGVGVEGDCMVQSYFE